MGDPGDPASICLERLEAVAAATAKALRQATLLSRGGAAEALAAAGALLPLALGRHARRRGGDRAASDVLAKYGPAEPWTPGEVVRRQLQRTDLSPRLGGLLGDDGPGVVAWIASRSGDDVSTLGRGLAAASSVALGALRAASGPPGFAGWLAGLPEAPLGDPASLARPGGLSSAWFSALRSRAFPWWTRVLP